MVPDTFCASTMSGLFLSDLHLFSRRSVGQQRWDQNRTLITAASTIVLGGDMFDFRWSQLGSINATLDAADQWLENAMALNPRASWVYLLGNHDCNPRLQNLLSSFGQRYSNFAWSPAFCRIGSNVFLHGDVLDGMRHPNGLDQYRAEFHDETPRGPIGNLLYSAVIQTRLHGLVPRLRHTHRQTCRRLLEYLDHSDAELLSSVRNIFFGHTHVQMSAYRFGGFEFHNAGSGIRYLTFTPATFDVTPHHE